MGKPLVCKLPRGRVVLLWERSPGATHLVVPGDASCWTSFGLGAHRSPGVLLFMGWELERGSQKPNWPSPSPLLLRRKHSEFGSCSLKTDTETGHDFLKWGQRDAVVLPVCPVMGLGATSILGTDKKISKTCFFIPSLCSTVYHQPHPILQSACQDFMSAKVQR